MTTCNCNLCRGLDAKRAAALTWLGDRWILAKPHTVARALGPIEIDVQAIAVESWGPPRLRLVKS